jgi:YebC/PmpR family DNA-binding regulatory protein
VAGHSKWANIKHKKARQDAKRGKVFTKIIREITVAARLGGGDPADNPRLRAAWDKALGQNMSKDTIERAIERGVGGADGANVEELTYEGYAPGGVAVLVEVMTDNRNRTVAEVRHALSRGGGNLGATGSVAWMFDRLGQIFLDATGRDEDTVMEAALEAGAADFVQDGDEFVVSTAPAEIHAVMDALRAGGYPVASSEIAMVPRNLVTVEGADAQKVLKLIDALEELDDVSKVFTNLDIDAVDLAEAEA